MRSTTTAAAVLLACAGCVPAGEGLRLETDAGLVEVEKLCAQAAAPDAAALPDRVLVRVGGRTVELKRLCPKARPEQADGPQD